MSHNHLSKVLRHLALTSADRVWFDDEPYALVVRTLAGCSFVYDSYPRRVLVMTNAELDACLASGRGRVEYGFYTPACAETRASG
ncbi:hypothetical protein FZ934_20160 (plasmid) [Rhizobium grahamii]|uniref:Uncharacterized protein n=1 Tax=Rhizobium grahamii TaxID=1120045 RepID=A0A5Q0C9Y0_9HYPH|nr:MULTISPECIES: hypothetical protein [Rhizobium]QFY62696.1 hypothetical protein FZ934_20160 [Rhizobium grahamii]QRM52560.1 hypothetical protein F3Y33_25500 [Rhizobium sp. BG6]